MYSTPTRASRKYFRITLQITKKDIKKDQNKRTVVDGLSSLRPAVFAF